ncbi:MAG: hypothetical protein WA951_01620 [Leeuwenhoekiella sp.]
MLDYPKLLVLFLILSFPMLINAQAELAGVEKEQFKLNILAAPSLDYEMRLTNTTTLGLQLGTSLVALTNQFDDDIKIDIAPAGQLYYRYYYNFDRREGKGKKTNHNSANYFSLISNLILAEPFFTPKDELNLEHDTYLEFGAVYGLQRTFCDWLNVGGNVGLGYAFISSNRQEVVPMLSLNVGWIFN